MNQNKNNKEYLGGYTKKLLSNQSILDVFVLQGLLDLEDCEKLRKKLRTNRAIEDFLIKNKLVTRETINKAYSIILKVPYISLKNLEIAENAKTVIPEQMAKKFKIIPFDLRGAVLKVAVIRPSELLVSYAPGINKLLAQKKMAIELYITSDQDFQEAIGQYKRKSGLLLKKSTLPLIFLRNRELDVKYLHKMPKDYVEKYGLVVFDRSPSGFYMVACEKYDSPVTMKLLDYIRKENNVELELFATSTEDIAYVLKNYENGANFVSSNTNQFMEISDEKKRDLRQDFVETVKSAKEAVSKTKDEYLAKGKVSDFTVDSVSEAEQDDLVEGPNQIKLTDREIDLDHLGQLPKQFIEKYRVMIFGETSSDELMLATDSPSDENTGKAIDFIKNQYPVKIFTTSSVEFNSILGKI